MSNINRLIYIGSLLLQIYLFFLGAWALADYGESCSATLPITLSDDDLKRNTAYGHLIQNIDIKSCALGCVKDDTKLIFCLRNPNITTTLNCTRR